MSGKNRSSHLGARIPAPITNALENTPIQTAYHYYRLRHLVPITYRIPNRVLAYHVPSNAWVRTVRDERDRYEPAIEDGIIEHHKARTGLLNVGCRWGHYNRLGELIGATPTIGIDADIWKCRVARYNATPQTHVIHGTVGMDLSLDDVSIAPSVVKVDIEGAEQIALDGASRLLTEIRPVWFVEVHPWAGVDPSEIARVFETCEYRVSWTREHDDLIGWIDEPPDVSNRLALRAIPNDPGGAV